MNMIEAYNYLFFDSIMGMLFVVAHRPFVFDVMVIFNTYNKIWMIIAASSGCTIGVILDWLLGIIVRSVLKPAGYIDNYRHYHIIDKIIRISWPFLLFFSFLPLGSAVIVSLGIYRISLRKILLLYIPLVATFYFIKS